MVRTRNTQIMTGRFALKYIKTEDQYYELQHMEYQQLKEIYYRI